MNDNFPVKIALTPRDKQSDAWLVLLPYFKKRLQDCRELNDGQHGAELTGNVRGQIAVWKELIELDKEAVVVESSNL